MPIHVLTSDVASKIAAGEIIERPASVVKELMENSLDAGATELYVDIQGSGVEQIRVVDNGKGIPFDEVELAVQRFATSKVTSFQDLESISTLGFRGEALPSIAAVSNLSLVTRSTNEISGTRLDVVDREIVLKEPVGTAIGTSVTVRHLFRNMPARRKFLRTPATETGRIQHLVTRYALAYPEIRFQLYVDRHPVCITGGSGKLREVVSAIHGLETAQAMIELSASPEGAENSSEAISGIISPPSLNRANRSYMSYFVNRRWVQSKTLRYAMEQAYHGFLPERRYPIVIVNINIPHHDVDVNVHPAKTEVRFRRENQVFSSLQRAIRQTLSSHSPIPSIKQGQVTYSGLMSAPKGNTFWPIRTFPPSSATQSDDIRTTDDTPDTSKSYASLQRGPREILPVLRVLGQVKKTYIVAEGPDGIYLIDQHAAHERVMFEKVIAHLLSTTVHSQNLLEALTLELSSIQVELINSHQELISKLGFQIEPFGANTYLLRGIPSTIETSTPEQALLDILDSMADNRSFESREERAAYSIACHSAIRAGKTLSPEEMSELTRQLEECQHPNTCPHGRPTMIYLSSSHLEKEFGRS